MADTCIPYAAARDAAVAAATAALRSYVNAPPDMRAAAYALWSEADAAATAAHSLYVNARTYQRAADAAR